MGMSKPVHVLPRGAEVEDIVNLTAIAVVEAQSKTSTVVEERLAEVAATAD
jgi:malate dehydrogenase (oxaloacetate-decarboxylating)(NADP+)